MVEKMFGRYDMRSTFQKYDPCVIGPKCSVECEECMVSLISDRFLGEKFAKEVLSKKFKKTRNVFPYVLIADTIGCDLDCWFCYAWRFLNLDNAKECITHFLSPQELARQFDCKIKKTADLEYVRSQIEQKTKFNSNAREKILRHINMGIPFTRIRISGGEPLFSNNNVFQADEESKDILSQRILYWIEFFEALDNNIGEIKQKDLINIATFDSEWQILNHPVWLTEMNDRIMIRFDTNGKILRNIKLTHLFYSELFRLFNEDKLNNIHVQIDYSFKGATVKEFNWAIKKHLPTTPENNDSEVDLDNHPQVPGLMNMRSVIDEFIKLDERFKDCVSYTVEKGIDHNPKEKLWVYYKDAFNWDELADKLDIKFSDVVNNFDLTNWNFDPKVRRYTKRGAMIKFTNGSETIDTTSANIDEIWSFKNKYIKSEDFMTLVYPLDSPVKLLKQPITKPTK